MGTTLTGNKVKDTYKSLIKITDSTEAGSSAKQLSDGNGNDLGLYVDTDGVFGIGAPANVSLDISSATDAIGLPVGTTANRPTGSAGQMRYNSTTGDFELYDTGWTEIFTTDGGTVSGDVTITGDLIVQGTTVTLNTETIEFEDSILQLNTTQGTPDTATGVVSGISIYRGDGVTQASFLFDDADDTWDLTNNLVVDGDLIVDTNTLYVDSANNRVGLGTDSPSTELHVKGSSEILRIEDSSDTGNPFMTFFQNGIRRSLIQHIDSGDTLSLASEYGNIRFMTGTGGTEVERMRITSGGDISFRDTSNNEAFYWDASASRLGIGHTAPLYPLHIINSNGNLFKASSSDTVVNMFLENNTQRVDLYSNRGAAAIQVDQNNESGAYDSTFQITIDNNSYFKIHTDGKVEVEDGDFVVDTNTLYVDSSNNRVGIGTTPSAKLDVDGSSIFRDQLNINPTGDPNNVLSLNARNSNDYANLVFRNSGGSANWAELVATTNTLAFETSGTERVRIDSSGRVGINETNPSTAKLVIQTDAGSGIDLYRSATNANFEAFRFRDSTNANTEASIGWSGDQLRLNSTNNTVLTTGGTERMRITSGGDISFRDTSANEAFYWDASTSSLGIGTDSPDTLLDVAKDGTGNDAPIIRITNKKNISDWSAVTDSMGKLEFYSDDSSGNAPYATGFVSIENDFTTGAPTLPSGALVFGTATYNASGGAVERVRIDSSGVVQVRNQTPTIQLYNTDTAVELNQTLGDIDWYQSDPSDAGVGTVAKIRAVNVGSIAGYGELAFHTGNASTIDERVRIDYQGKVGIGTASPLGKLHVSTGNDSNSGNIEFIIGGTEGTNARTGRIIKNTSSPYEMTIRASDFATGSNLILNDTGGNVGIGTTSPASYLEVETESASGNDDIAVFSRSTYGEVFKISREAGEAVLNAKLNLTLSADYTGLQTSVNSNIIFKTDTSEKMRITSGGNLGVGLTNPIEKLDVNGVMRAFGYESRSGTNGIQQYSGEFFNIFWTGSAAQLWIDTSLVGTLAFTSDYRVKKNIETQEVSAIDRINALRPVKFEYADYEDLFVADDVQREGFIAHEVAEIIPSAVEGEKDAENALQSLKLDAMMSVAVKAIQEQQEIINDLKARIETLENQ